MGLRLFKNGVSSNGTKTSIELRFSKVCEISEGRFVLELDDEVNENKNVFVPKVDTAYIRLFPCCLMPTLRSNLGTVSLVSSSIPKTIEQDIVFRRTKTASLSYPLFELVSWTWLGRTYPENVTLTITNWDITASEEVPGIARITYVSYFDRIALSGVNQEAEVLVEVIKESMYGSIVINFKVEEVPVYLTVRDACTRLPIEDVSVYVDGKFVGVTTENGQINLGKLRTGKHSLKMTKFGYQPSDEDMIANDYFVVE